MQASIFIPKFADENLREKTFLYYNGECDVSKIVKCGLFLKDNRSELCCFHCGISFSDFCPETDFLTLHLKLSPNCGYLLENLSNRQFRNILKRSTYLKPQTYFIREKAPFNIEFSDCSSRLESLKSLYIEFCSKKKIARAGFFYSQHSRNILTCFECGLNIHSSITENPWHVHSQLSPRCRYLLLSKGFFYIQKHSII